MPVMPVARRLERDPRVTDISIGYSGVPLTVDGTSADGMALTRVRGRPLLPNVTEGRQPVGPHEVMLGVRTLADLHLHLGSTVDVTLSGTPSGRHFTVVGAGVFPSLSDTLSLGQGTALTVDGIRAIVGGTAAPPPETALVRLRPGVDHAAVITALNRELGDASLVSISAPMQPVDLVNFGRVANLPLFVGALLGLLAAAALAHLLVTSIRRRERDRAILKVVGFVPSQLRRTVAWQATVIAVASLVVGVPVGIVVGRWVWLAFAHQLGVIPDISIRPWLVVLLAVAVLLTANLIALVPAAGAARTPVAETLRTT